MKRYLLISCIFLGGCASTIDSLSNNRSRDLVHGSKIGIDAKTQSIDFNVGTIEREGKADSGVIGATLNGAFMAKIDYNTEFTYELTGTDTKNPRQFIKTEKRTATPDQQKKGMSFEESNKFGFQAVPMNFSTGGHTRVTMGEVQTEAFKDINEPTMSFKPNEVNNIANATPVKVVPSPTPVNIASPVPVR